MSLTDAFGLQVLKTAEEETHGWKMMIGGKWVESRSGKRMTSINPAYDEAIAEVPAGNAEDIQLAVEAGKAAFPAWSKMHVDDRAKHCKQFANAVRGMSRELGMLEAIDSGNPFLPMVDDAKKGASLHDFFSGLGMEMKGETIPTPGGGLDYTRPQPFGVVGRIIPFNHAISFAAGKIAPALVAGNTVILKPADQTPLSALWTCGALRLPAAWRPAAPLHVLQGSKHSAWNWGAKIHSSFIPMWILTRSLPQPWRA